MSLSYLLVDIICFIELLFIFFKTLFSHEKTARHNCFLWLIGFAIGYTILDAVYGYSISISQINSDYVRILSPLIQAYAYLCLWVWMRYVQCYTESKLLNNYFFQGVTFFPVTLGIVFTVFNLLSKIQISIDPVTGMVVYKNPGWLWVASVLTTLSCLESFPFAIKNAVKKFKTSERESSLIILALSFWPFFLYPIQVKFYDSPISSLIFSVPCLVFYFISISESQKKSSLIKRQKTLLENLLKQEQISNYVINSIAKMYFCIYYINLKDKSFMEITTSASLVHDILGEDGKADDKMDLMCKYLVSPEYSRKMQEFTYLDTLPDRIEDEQYISIEFFSPQVGWCEGYFIAAERNLKGKLTDVIWAVRSIKKEKELLIKSNTDELTGFYNRRAYDECINEYKNGISDENFAVVAFDLNGLKAVNDNIGHIAGDELIKGAAECMRSVYGKYGKLFRTGGDEFFAVLSVEAEMLPELKKEFDSLMKNWRGVRVKELSISSGYVSKKEFPELSFEKMAHFADKRMYEEKSDYYSKSGIDRRGHQQAFK